MTASPPQSAGLARAEALLRVGRTDSARELAAEVLGTEPENVDALCLLARSYQIDGDFPAMCAVARQAVAVAPDHAEAQVVLAFALVELGDPEPARTSAEQSVRLASDDWRGHAALALAQFNLGQRRRAFRTIRRAVELAPNLAEPHFVRGRMLQAAGRAYGARRCYRRALALDPEHAASLAALGRIAVGGNRLATAGGHIAAALATDPTDHAARTELDRMLIGGLAGWALMAVWVAGLLAMFAMLPMVWLLPLTVVAPAAWWMRRTWSRLPPSIRTYAMHLMRGDIRARVRLAGLSASAVTGTGLGIAAVLQGADEPPTAAWLIFVGAHWLVLFATSTAIFIADRRVAGPPRTAGRAPRTGPVPPPTDLLDERREDADAARWGLRLARTGGVLAVVPTGMSMEPPGPWPTRAAVGAVALALFVGYARWSRRRLMRRPGRPNALLGMLVAPLGFAALAEFAVIAASVVLPPAAMPLPEPVAVPASLVIAAGLVAWLLWLPYAAVCGLIRLVRREPEAAAGSRRLGA